MTQDLTHDLTQEPISAEPSSLQRELVAACRILVSEGVSGAAFNVSCRLDGDRWMTIPVTSPTLVTEDNVVVSELQGGFDGWKAHPAIYRQRADVGGIVHVHPLHVVAFSTLDEDFVPVHHYGAPFHGMLATYTSTGQTKNEDRAAEMARQLGQNRALLQRGHGVITVGKDLREAVLLALYLEEALRVKLLAGQMGTPRRLSREESEVITPQILKQRSQDKMWDHCLSQAKINGYL